MSKEFLFKDVLFGLRPEYLKMETKLKKLKDFSIVLDDNIENFDYFIFKWDMDMKPEIGCRFKRKESILKKLHVFTSSLGYVKNRSTILVRDNNNNYNMRESNFPIVLDNSNYLHELILEILDSEFANNMCVPYIRKELFNDEFIFKIKPTYIGLDIQNDLMKNILDFSADDIIRFCTESPKFGQELLSFIFNKLQIPNDMLNEYQQDIIIQNNPFEKKVYLPEIIEQSNKFTIDECSKKFILKR